MIIWDSFKDSGEIPIRNWGKVVGSERGSTGRRKSIGCGKYGKVKGGL